MQSYPIIFTGAGQKIPLNVQGRYLTLLRLDTNPVSVRLYLDGKKLDLGEITQWTTGPLAGLEVGPLPLAPGRNYAFDRIEIESTGADTCVVGIGDGSVRYQRSQGSVSIVSPLAADNADALANLGATGVLAVGARMQGYNGATWDRLRSDNVGGVGSQRVTERGFLYAASAVNLSANAANTPISLVAPASNTNGMIVWAGRVWGRMAGAGIIMALIAKSSAPAGVSDGDVLCGQDGSLEYTGPISHGWGVITRAMFVASGKGIYKMNSQAEANQFSNILYTLL